MPTGEDDNDSGIGMLVVLPRPVVATTILLVMRVMVIMMLMLMLIAQIQKNNKLVLLEEFIINRVLHTLKSLALVLLLYLTNWTLVVLKFNAMNLQLCIHSCKQVRHQVMLEQDSANINS